MDFKEENHVDEQPSSFRHKASCWIGNSSKKTWITRVVLIFLIAQMMFKNSSLVHSHLFDSVALSHTITWTTGEQQEAAAKSNPARGSQEVNQQIQDILTSEEYIATHQSDKDGLELLHWERACLEDGFYVANGHGKTIQRACKPPPEIPRHCCLGTKSAGGEINPSYTSFCARAFTPDSVQFLEQQAANFFRKNPTADARDNSKQTIHTNETTRKVVNCDVCRMVEMSRRLNLIIALTGDSMQLQVYQGLHCELLRRGYIVKKVFSKIKAPPQTEKKNVPGPHKSGYSYLMIRSLLWEDPNQWVTWKNFPIYRLPFALYHEQEALAQADVVMLGFGLHVWYNPPVNKHRSPVGYTKNVEDVLRYLAPRVPLLVHRETTAQHFDSLEGEFSMRNMTAKGCVPMKHAPMNSPMYNWRQKCVEKGAKKANIPVLYAGPAMPPLPVSNTIGSNDDLNGTQRVQPNNFNYNELVILPYHEFTSKMHRFHGGTDCTHYCSTPILYAPLWRSLRIAMDRQFAPA